MQSHLLVLVFILEVQAGLLLLHGNWLQVDVLGTKGVSRRDRREGLSPVAHR